MNPARFLTLPWFIRNNDEEERLKRKEGEHMGVLKLGIPKGSLENATIALFEKSGWQIK